MREKNDNVNHSGGAPEDGVLDLIHAVMHQYRAQQFQVLRDGPHDVTHMESKVMGYFGRCPGATQSDLARHSGRDKAQLARLIKGLRERGMLEGEADETDRRNTRLRLTAAGAAVQETLQQQAKLLNAKAVRGLDAAQRAQLTALLQQVSASLAAAPS
ncbi:MarR family winged helix-turn-helix transcriptional regulator [Janthinobacterium fluminis]|uniref:MarR family winged helix-turn-helix transcriptional regulator n=1 Tax=Janthinobacterium fluminis TaxID=2987524 RepID=A0ABT5JZU8_9BURK|nr:MarR family winged helix-turn-helix transcriptional regulator [Janthinobacterium fluminis]MDC8758258.1 MarR family winged helix-turn-helix transcriptional regulator [Janthinobacterium fluminis]